MKKKDIVKYALVLSSACLVNGASAQDVSNQPEFINNAPNSLVKISDGTETDYDFIVKNLNITNYYKIDINSNKIGTSENINWSTDPSNAAGSVILTLPNDKDITLYYTYTTPDNYTLKVHVEDMSEDIENIVFGSFNPAVYSNQGVNNTKNNNVNITAEFIKNSVVTNSSSISSMGGAIYNSGSINKISGNFLENYTKAVGGSLGGAIYNEGTASNIVGDFINNYVTSSGGSMTVGGAIYNKNIIRNISGDFIGNYSSSNSSYYVSGGAIYNENTINNIIGNFIGNCTTSAYSLVNSSDGGAISNKSKIDNLEGVFISNYSTASSTKGSAYGGAIYNEGTINRLTGDFIGNYAKKSTNINSDTPYYAKGGAIYNLNTNGINIVNSKFIGNNASVATGEAYAEGGAIYTHGNITISADNGNSEFSGNYISTDGGTTKDYQAIYVGSDSATLALQAYNNGAIIFDDKISGENGYKIAIDGDLTSKVELNNLIENANVYIDNTNIYIAENTLSDTNTTTYVNSGTINLANGTAEDYQINKLVSDPNAKYTIDVDNSIKLAPVPDTITTGAGSNGRVTISDIEMLNPSNDFNVQVLYAENDNIQLDLSNDLKNKFNTTTVEKLYTSDEMRSDVWWDEQFHTYEQDKNITSTIALDTTTTTNDSIKYTQESTLGAIVDTGSYGNTLALINQYDNVAEDRNFNFDTENDVYEVTQNLGTTSAGTLNINGIANEDQRSTINGNGLSLFTLNNETNLNVNNTKITGAQSVVTGYNKDAVLTLNNVEIKDNTNGIETAGSIYVKGNSIFENNGEGIKVTSSSSVITLDATGSEITLKDKLSGVSGAKLNLKGGPVNFEKEVSVLDVTMSEALGNLRKDNVFNGLNLTVDKQSTINIANNSTNIMNLNSLTLNNNLNMHVDVDLANRSMDRIVAKNYNVGDYFVNVTKMNMLSDSDSVVTKVLFADDKLKNNVSTTVSEVAYSPIWKYGVTYDKTDGQFTFTRGGGSSPVPPAPTIDTLNPSLMVSPVAAQLGGYMGMLDTYANAFTHMDMNMLKPSSVRFAEANANKYAVADVSPRAYNSNEMNSKGIWFKPYTSYDSVGLKNGPKVSSFSYGSFIGGDSELHKFKNGFSGVISPYIAYQGSHQSFRGNSVYQNGGTIGLTGTLYKGNFFTGLTAGIGASVADANTMYGHEDFPMLMSGIASKTGYNFEFKDGRYIIQPSLLLSYTFVNTFNYTNNTGVSIDSDPLHAIQILPSVRFVMNTKNGWQPYLTAGMNWNILDETKVTANMTSLPQMSMKPYVQYGVGVQRTMKDRLTAYLQVVLRHGGRNGIAATGGLRYMFGKEPIKNNKDL